MNAVNGVATFSGLELDQAGAYGVSIVSGAAAPGVTGFSIVAAAASQLAVTTQPPSATVNAPFEVDISAEDPFGNVDTTFSGNVTVSLANNPDGATLGGTLTVAAINGVASFTGLTLNSPDDGYTLQAVATGLTSVTTSAIDVLPTGVTTQLSVTSEPPYSVTAGSGFGLVVAAEDGLGTIDTSFDGTMTLTLNSSSGGTLGGTLTAQAVNGVATFSGLTIDQAGDEYSLTATSNSISTTTYSFTVNPGAASQLVISAPQDVLAGSASAFSNYVIVNAEDPYGNIDPNFYGEVTLALANNPGNTALSGTLTTAADEGEADFEPLFSLPGNGITLQATSPGLGTGVSSPFNVTNDELMVTFEPPSFVAAGNDFSLIVTAYNKSGVDSSFNGNVTISLPGLEGRKSGRDADRQRPQRHGHILKS